MACPQVQRALGDVIHGQGYVPQNVQEGDEDDLVPFLLDLSYPSNVTHWVLIRQTMLLFGHTFHARIRLFSSYYALLQFLILVYVGPCLLVSGELRSVLVCCYLSVDPHAPPPPPPPPPPHPPAFTSPSLGSLNITQRHASAGDRL